MSPLIIIGIGGLLFAAVLYFAFSGPSAASANARRLGAIKDRYGTNGVSVDAQLRKVSIDRGSSAQEATGLAKLLPNPEQLAKRIEMTGKPWTVRQYFTGNGVIALVIAALAMIKGAPAMLALLAGLAIGLMLPHMAIGYLIKKRLNDFNARFPDAIELMVRGLRSGLPISETLGIVAQEIPGPVGIEFRQVTERVKIGRTMDEALDEAAVRLGTPEFKFFCITLSIQRETGGNLAETLANLADVLRKRAQMKLKIKAMSSESKASAYIVGSLPFVVFGLVWSVNPEYLAGFFKDERLIIAGIGGMIWMSIGGFIMAKMVNFEI